MLHPRNPPPKSANVESGQRLLINIYLISKTKRGFVILIHVYVSLHLQFMVPRNIYISKKITLFILTWQITCYLADKLMTEMGNISTLR